MGLLAFLALLSLAGTQARQPLGDAGPRKPSPVQEFQGTVEGPDGKPLEDALVIVRAILAPPNEKALVTRTDRTGTFRIRPRSHAAHELRVEAIGFEPARLKSVNVGTPLRIVLTRGRTIEGTVRDAETGRPVERALVRATNGRGSASPFWEVGAGGAEATTDSRGRFRLSGVGTGSYLVTAEARGHGSAVKKAVASGEHRLELLLVNRSSISGVVADAHGHRLRGVSVRADGGLDWSPTGLVVTDEQGQYDFVGLESGSYVIAAHHEGHAVEIVDGVVLNDGGVDVRADLVLGPRHRVVGRIFGSQGRPVDARVSLLDLNGKRVPLPVAQLLSTDTVHAGRFAIDGFPPGSHALSVEAPDHVPQRVEFDVPVQKTQVDVGTITLTTGLTLHGTVRDREGRAIRAANVEASCGDATGWRRSSARSGADGGFVLGGLFHPTCRLAISADGFAPLRVAARVGEELDVTLDLGGGVAGSVVDASGRAIETYQVAALSADGGQRIPSQTDAVDSEGRFTLTDVDPGVYLVNINADGHPSATLTDVNVAAGSITDVGQIRLAEGGILFGQVVSSDGTPVAGASVSLRGRESVGSALFGEGASTTTDLSGVFEFTGLTPGLVDLVGSHPDYAPGSVARVRIDPESGPTEARVVLLRGGRLEGTARRRDGVPLFGTMVQAWPVAREVPLGFDSMRSATVSPEGTFTLERLPAGRSRIVLMHRAGSTYRSVLTQEVEMREGETTTVGFVTREILISGRVTRGQRPMPNVQVTFTGGGLGWSTFGTTPAVAGDLDTPERQLGVTREDGQYSLLLDQPGEYQVSVEALDEGVNRWIHVGVPDADVFTFDVTLGTASVSGIVLDQSTEQPVPRASVSVGRLDVDDAGGLLFQAGTDGRFSVEVKPGEYTVRAWARRYGEATALVTVDETGAPNLQLSLGPAKAIRGHVLAADGAPVPGLSICASPGHEVAAGPSNCGVSVTDGSFSIDGLSAESSYTLYAASLSRGVGFVSGAEVGAEAVTVELAPPAELRLVVRGPGGVAVPGAVASVLRVRGLPVVSDLWLVTDENGVVSVPAPKGLMELRVATKQGMQATASREIPAGQTVMLELQLQPPEPPR